MNLLLSFFQLQLSEADKIYEKVIARILPTWTFQIERYVTIMK